MADVVYSVAVEYLQSGNLSLPTGLKAGAEHLEKASKAFEGVAGAAGMFNSLLDTVGGAMMNLATGAGMAVGAVLAGGFAMAVKEAFHFNQELENTQISLANIANASGTTANLGGAMRLAGDVVKQMRVDARELPGEFKDLQNIMGLMESATSNAGIGMFGTEKMAAQVMTAASQLKISYQVAGREMSMMLAGNARHSMPLFTKLGFTDSKSFNKLSQEGRVSAINEKLTKLNSPEALNIIKNTWEVIRSTAIDSVRQATAAIGGPLFERVKEVVTLFNNLGKSDSAREQWQRFATKFGQQLVNAFDHGLLAIEKWHRPVLTFLGTMERGFARVFGSMGHLLGGVTGHIENFMNNPAAFSKIEHLVGQLIALRAGGAALQGGASAASGALSAAPGLIKMAGAVGGLTEMLAIAAPLAAGLALVTLAAYGVFDMLTNASNSWHDIAVAMSTDIVKDVHKAGSSFTELLKVIEPLTNALGFALMGYILMTVDAFQTVVTALTEFWGAIRSITEWVIGQKLGPTEMDSKAYNDHLVSEMDQNLMPSRFFNAPPEPSDIGAKKPPQHTTHIHKVEIKVNSNQDPSRIARATVDMLKDLARNPTSAAMNPSSRFSRGGGF